MKNLAKLALHRRMISPIRDALIVHIDYLANRLPALAALDDQAIMALSDETIAGLINDFVASHRIGG